MYITPFYAAILGLFFVFLSVRTLRLRRKLRIAIGDAGNQEMLRGMRAHSNFVEYAPFALLLIFMLETEGAAYALIHALCICLLLGRLVHAYGVSNPSEDYRYRVFGMTMTFMALAGSAVCLLTWYVFQLVAQ